MIIDVKIDDLQVGDHVEARIATGKGARVPSKWTRATVVETIGPIVRLSTRTNKKVVETMRRDIRRAWRWQLEKEEATVESFLKKCAE